MSQKATLDKLAALHGKVAEVLTEALEACHPELAEDDSGEVKLVGYDARLVADTMKFLKDNDITADVEVVDAGAAHEALQRLRGKKRTSNDPFDDIPVASPLQ